MKKFGAVIIIVLGGLLLISCFWFYDLQQYFTLDYLKSRHDFYTELYLQNPILTLSAFFSFFMLLTALSIPGLSIFILAGGSIFGFTTTLVLISFADVFGSVFAFLGSRHLFGHHLQRKYPTRLRAVNQGICCEGAFYLISLRLIPLFPCFLINLLMGLTRIRSTTFYWATQVGKLPHNAIYVNAGTQMGKADSFFNVLTPEMFFSFALIGIFPLLAKRWLQRLRTRKTVEWTVTPAPQMTSSTDSYPE